MLIKHLILSNFRNIKDVSWNPQPGINVIMGDNAQGKTNLLEAIHFVCTGSSFRTVKKREMISHEADSLFVRSQIKQNGSDNEISVSLSHHVPINVRLNGQKQNKNNIFQFLSSISFTPMDLDLVCGNPAGRRRWLDYEVCSFDSKYQHYLYQYHKILLQKNSLLRDKFKTSESERLLDVFNIQLIDYGSYIISARLHCLSKLYPIFKNIYQDITSGKEKIFFKYFSSIPLQDTFEFLSIKNYFAKAIEEKKKEEYFQKKSLVGPHRDDVVFYVNDLEAKRYCSRGQQRSIVLALKIAIMNVFKEESGEYPLLLLDDLMLELDQSRQQSVAKLLYLPEQSFITTTVLPAEFLLPYTAIKMHDGQLFVVRGD